jgi:hypothetical protein
MSPNQAERGRPEVADDIYAIGACLLLLLTGTDPQRIQHGAAAFLPQRLAAWMGVRVTPELEVVASACALFGNERPTLSRLDEALSRMFEQSPAAGVRTDLDFGEAAARGARGLVQSVAFGGDADLWLSYAFSDPVSHREGRRPQYQLMPDANRGVAGVVYLTAQLRRAGLASDELLHVTERVLEWLLSASPPAGDLPGLHFGSAGRALATVEAWAAGFSAPEHGPESVRSALLSAKIDWPDVTHGAAGQGIAALRIADSLGTPQLHDLAGRCADYLLSAQDESGTWPLPGGVPTIEGDRFSGFAHGAAGILYFLSEVERRTGRDDVKQAVRRGVEGLLQLSTLEAGDGIRSWPVSERRGEVWRWWCHGSPGIALLFLRLYEVDRDPRWKAVATQCLRQNDAAPRAGNLSVCHGLAGLGEVYLEASRVLEDGQWYERALEIAHLLVELKTGQHDEAIAWVTEEMGMPTADLMVGSGGVVHFLLRLARPDLRLPFPLLLPPVA